MGVAARRGGGRGQRLRAAAAGCNLCTALGRHTIFVLYNTLLPFDLLCSFEDSSYICFHRIRVQRFVRDGNSMIGNRPWRPGGGASNMSVSG